MTVLVAENPNESQVKQTTASSNRDATDIDINTAVVVDRHDRAARARTDPTKAPIVDGGGKRGGDAAAAAAPPARPPTGGGGLASWQRALHDSDTSLLSNGSTEWAPPTVPAASFPDLLEALRSDETRAVVVTEPCPPFYIAHVNSAWEELCGYDARDVVGRTIGSILHGPDTDRAALKKFRCELTEQGCNDGGGGTDEAAVETGIATSDIQEGATSPFESMVHAALAEFSATPTATETAGTSSSSPVKTVTAINYRKDKTAFRNQIHAAPLMNEADGTVQYFVAVLRDLSEWVDDERDGLLSKTTTTHASSPNEEREPAVVVVVDRTPDGKTPDRDRSTTRTTSSDDGSISIQDSKKRDTDSKHDSCLKITSNYEVARLQQQHRPSYHKRVSFEDMFDDDENNDDDEGIDDTWHASNRSASAGKTADKPHQQQQRPSLAQVGRRLSQNMLARRDSLQSLDSVLSSSSAANNHWCWGNRKKNSKNADKNDSDSTSNGRSTGNSHADGCMDKCWTTWKRQHFKPAIPTSEEELESVRDKRGANSWQLKAVKWVNSHWVQKVLVSLLLCDVLILFIELYLDVAFPSCTTITRDAISCCPADCSSAHQDNYSDGKDYDNYGDDEHHLLRFLGGGGGSGHGYCEYPYQDSPEFPSACDDHKYEAVHTFHSVLFACTIFILSTFMVEILLLVVCLGPKLFFSRFLYVLDFIVIGSSLALELIFATLDDAATADIAGLLVVFRLWRFVRIGHGLVASTHEMAEHKMNALKKYTRQLEDEVIEGGGVLPESRWSLGLLESAVGARAGEDASSGKKCSRGLTMMASARTFNVAVGGKVVSSKNLMEVVDTCVHEQRPHYDEDEEGRQ